MKQITVERVNWHSFSKNFGKNYLGCPMGEHNINDILSSMNMVEKFMSSDEYRIQLMNFINGIEKEYTWH